jgi:hypothetical protein
MPDEKVKSGYHGMAELRAAEEAKAQAVAGLPNLVLDNWLARQRKALEATLTRYVRAIEAAMRDPALDDLKAPDWERYWVLDARIRWTDETLALLNRRTHPHVLVCPNHGIQDPVHGYVPLSEWAAALGYQQDRDGMGYAAEDGTPLETDPADWYEGLALRGVLTGEGAMGWNRYCEPCAKDTQIAVLAGNLWRAHRLAPLPSSRDWLGYKTEGAKKP